MNPIRNLAFIEANWLLDKHRIGAVHTTRHGGCSTGSYHSLNLGYHVGDEKANVDKNHQIVERALGLDYPLQMVQQVHGNRVIELKQPLYEAGLDKTDFYQNLPQADAMYTCARGLPLCILTADCLPIFLANRTCDEIAVIHGGWRSLSQGIIDNTLKLFTSNRKDIVAYMGPALGLQKFEVDDEVKQAFIKLDSQLEVAFLPGENANKSLADLYQIGRMLLERSGVQQSYNYHFCTHTDVHMFFSYRHNATTGRMGNIIWLL